MIKAAANLEPGDIIHVNAEYETVSDVVDGPFNVQVLTSQGRQYQFDLTRPMKVYPETKENPQLEQYKHDLSLYTSDLEERVRRLEAANERLRALAEVVARGNTDADELADMAKRELNR